MIDQADKNRQSRCSKYRILLLKKYNKYEEHIKSLLDSLNIRYIREKGFFVGPWKDLMFADFYLPKPYKICIEVDGEYHDSVKQKIRDKNKDEFYTKRGFKVLRINYKQLHGITKPDDLYKLINNL